MSLGVVLALALGTARTVVADGELDPKRPLPDYDGRGNVDAHAGGGAWWIPRIVLAPVYFVEEYVLRRPLGWLITHAEQDHWLDTAIDAFTFGPEHNFILVPTVLVDLGLLPTVGLYFSGDNAFAVGNSIVASGSTAGPKAFTVTLLDRYTFRSGSTTVGARLDVKRELDFLYFGTGPDVTSATQSRYGLQMLDAHASLKRRMLGESGVSAYVGVRTVAYRAGDCCGDPSIDQRIADGSLMPPPGFGTPYTLLYQRAELVLDSRPPRPAPATGGYLLAHGETDFDVRNDRSWIKYGGVLGGALDLDGHQRTLHLLAAVDLVDPARGEIPFNELASLGSNLMPGFVGGWMLGRSTVASQLSYTWPVSVWLDGEVIASAGNAFGEHFDGFALEKLRLSGDLGVRTIGARDEGFELLFGLGTETIERGADITSVRVAIGARKGF